MKDPTLRNLWKAIFWVSFPFGILSFVLPIYGRQLGASALEIGGFFSAVSVVPVFVRPFLGRIMDRWGRRPFLLAGLFGYAIAMVVFSLSNTILQLTLARFIQGLGQAFLWLAAFTIVADVAQETGRGYDFGLIDEAISRGALIGTSAGFFALFSLDQLVSTGSQVWLILFAGYTLPALIALGIGWRGVPETRPQRSGEKIHSQPLSRQLFTLMIIVFFTGASSMMVWPLLMIFLQDTLGAEVWGLAIAYLPAALISAFLPSRIGKTRRQIRSQASNGWRLDIRRPGLTAHSESTFARSPVDALGDRNYRLHCSHTRRTSFCCRHRRARFPRNELW
ncbi:MAG: MFS transporter, partial [Anaerolineales bacterium]